MDSANVRALPPHVAAVCILIAVICLVRIWRSEQSSTVRFLALALWFRYMAAEFPGITFTSVGGASIIALISLATIAIGVLVQGTRIFKSLIAIPCYLLIFANMSSGLLNGQLGGAIDGSIKAIYFLVMASAATRAFLEVGSHRASKALLAALTVPVVFQIIGMVFGVVKASEADGSASAIGGFNHESGFSMVALTFILVAGIYSITEKVRGLAFLSVGMMSIVLANYRTSLLAGLPIIVAIGLSITVRSIRRDQKMLLPLIIMPIAAGMVLLLASFQDRFVDMFDSAEMFDNLIVAPQYYTEETRKLLSGRPFIWSQYLTRYLHGTDLQLLFGYGPDSWEGIFKVYAHNTIVSALHDMGVIGFFATFIFLIGYALLTGRALRGQNWFLILLAYVGFFLLNMSTMPIWSIEGLIFYSLLVGFSFSEAIRVSHHQRQKFQMSPRGMHTPGSLRGRKFQPVSSHFNGRES